jgi:hypothetical protein
MTRVSSRPPRSHGFVARLAGAALATVVAGCGLRPAPSPAGTTTPSAAAPSVVEPSASPADTRPWGPLAVIPPQDGSDTALLTGTLRITDRCVYLDAVDASLLFWPADLVLWSPDTRTITFRNGDGERVSVVSGDRIAVGGSGDSTADSGVPGVDWVARLGVVVPPDPSCSLDVRWVVGAVSREG